MVPLVGFCGASGSGKTTLVEKVIAELTSRGLKVGAIKHHGHGGAIENTPEISHKDSTRLQKAGALRTGLSHSGGVSLHSGLESAGWQPEEIASRLMYDMDIVIVEGFKKANIEKIEVIAPGKEPILPEGGTLLALARRGGDGEESGLRVLDADDHLMISDFALAAAMRQKTMQANGVRVSIQGKKLPINGFSQRIIENTIRGLLAGFKGGDQPGSIEVLIEPNE